MAFETKLREPLLVSEHCEDQYLLHSLWKIEEMVQSLIEWVAESGMDEESRDVAIAASLFASKCECLSESMSSKDTERLCHDARMSGGIFLDALEKQCLQYKNKDNDLYQAMLTLGRHASSLLRDINAIRT